MRKIELAFSMERLVPTVQFGNRTVFFSFKEIMEGEYTDQEIKDIQKDKFKKFCFEPSEEEEKEILLECIQRELKHLRILKCPECGKMHPSITTVRDFESKGFYCSDEELAIATADGSLKDIKNRHFVLTGEWKKAKDIELCWPHLAVIKGSKIDPDSFDFPAFLKDYPIEKMVNGVRMWDCENELTFEPDLFGTPVGWDLGTKKEPSPVEETPSVFDYKRNIDKLSAFTQMSVSAKKLGLKQMIIIPVNGETAQGYSKPVISRDVNGYFEIAMDKRRKFRRRYGV